jgi:hypothetical protein
VTRSEITKHALEELTLRHARVRQVHNVPVRRRQNHIQKGWPDIQGYSSQGVAILVEVKTATDKLRKEQVERLNDAKNCNCICMIATVNDRGKFILTSYEPVCDTRTAALIQ